MVPSLVRNLPARLVAVVTVVLVLVSVTECEAKKCGVICRVRDPTAIGRSHMLKECLYEVYPVESTQNTVGGTILNANADSRNRLFSLYGGPSSCEYFGTMIQTTKGRQTLVETIQRQLQKSGFKGLDLQCDPTEARVTQQTYADFVEQLRNFLGNTYVIMVTMSSCQPESKLVESLNRAVDFVTINTVGQASTLTNALLFGLARHRILLAAPYPPTIQCPLNSDHSLNEVLSHIDQHNLFGTVVQLDRDDVHNVCGEGPFPLFRKVLDRLCPDAECSFNGFVRDTRDCGQYYSCENGYKKPHHCPTGYSFDLCKSSCEPFLQVNCNSTTCLVSGGLPNGLMPIPYPIPFPIANTNCSIFNNGGGDNNNGGNNNNGGGQTNTSSDCCCDVLKNLTLILTGTDQFSELIAFVKDIGLDGTFGVLRQALVDLTPLLNSVVSALNNLLSNVLLGQNTINNTTNGLLGLDNSTNVLSQLIGAVVDLLNNLLGSGSADGLGGGLLGGLLGGGAPAPAAPAVGAAAAALGALTGAPAAPTGPPPAGTP